MNQENMTRKELLQKYSQLIARREEFIWNDTETVEMELPDEAETMNQYLKVEDDESTLIGEEIYRLREIYRDSLLDLALSRCPFTGEVLFYSLDYEGLDGLWWNYFDPIRKEPPKLDTFLALTGAMKLNPPVENTDFLVEVGPEIPYVLPALLEEEDVLAVLSSFKVGAHTAYAIVYYSLNPSSIVIRPNEWGTDRYYYLEEDGNRVWSQAEDIISQRDYDLASWIEEGKLLWIMPGDKELNLRADTRQCPFLDLEGNKNIQIIRGGEISLLESEEELEEDWEEVLSTLEVSSEDLTPIPEDLWKLLPQEGENNEQ